MINCSARLSWLTRNNIITASADNIPPTKAEPGSVSGPSTSPKRVITSTAPAEAPEDRPNKNGSASSLRVVVCKSKPTIASPAPVSAASRTRGRRKSMTIVFTISATGADARPNADSTCRHESSTLPHCRLAIIMPHKTTDPSAVHRTKRCIDGLISRP